MGLFKKSSWGAVSVGASQPNPYNFRVISEEHCGGYIFAEIDYPDATNFEGRKLIVCKTNKNSLTELNSLDPHFLISSDVKIIARFRPDNEGRLAMLHLFKLLKGDVK